MIKIKKLNNRGLSSCYGARLAKLGDIITLKNGDIVGVTMYIDDTKSCKDFCYFASNDCLCKGADIVKKEVPNFELYIKPIKFKNCFLWMGWYFVKIGNKKEGI